MMIVEELNKWLRWCLERMYVAMKGNGLFLHTAVEKIVTSIGESDERNGHYWLFIVPSYKIVDFLVHALSHTVNKLRVHLTSLRFAPCCPIV